MAADGVTLAGRVFGTGVVGIVLVHYADPARAQAMWFPMAQTLAAQSYRALTFDLRGYCPGDLGGCSSGTFVKTEAWHDVVLAADWLRTHGVRKVFVMGAGLGGHAGLWAASRPGVRIDGVISVSSPQLAIGGPASYDLTPAVLRSIKVPILFVAGAVDDAEAQPDAKAMYAAARPPKQIALLPSDKAGPELFGETQDVGTRAVLQFLAAHS